MSKKLCESKKNKTEGKYFCEKCGRIGKKKQICKPKKIKK